MATAKATEAIEAAKNALAANGWRHVGGISIPTGAARSAAGWVATGFSERAKFRLGDSDRFVTVGARTTCFYRRDDKGCTDFVRVATKDLAAVTEVAMFGSLPAASP